MRWAALQSWRFVLPGLLVAWGLGAFPKPAMAAPPVPEPVAAPVWTPPVDAVLEVDAAYVRQRPDSKAPIVGLLRRDSRFRVTGCSPSCEAPQAWALLGEHGAIRLELLGLAAPDIPALEQRPEFIYGKVLRPGADVLAEPAARARRVRREAAGRVLAFTRDEALLAQGWLLRPGGGFVSVKQIRIDEPSPFRGEERPRAPMAFLWKPARLTADVAAVGAGASLDGGVADAGVPDAGASSQPPEPLSKFTRLPLLGLTKREVRVPGGTLPRGAVRLAFARPRPASIPAGAKWVHVDLDEQVLTAYEGDTWVYATLVSTGKKDTPTHKGTYRVWSKTLHELMAEENEYFVEEVPYTQYFHAGEALHGAFWHASFGAPVTHGCVNLSLPDARWLFFWAPPALPSGWHSYSVTPGVESLWVVVEHAKPGELPPVPVSEVGSSL
ncbi:L,D-transpeptidase [Hyalangium gracile]|uniref:L,D-transpeptidase n=1 Tax=Hyalangium gracile TaxID=394092 RepID=UPI001CCC3F9B|nr:L,D-transpeptidase [Hyalangium gracile]